MSTMWKQYAFFRCAEKRTRAELYVEEGYEEAFMKRRYAFAFCAIALLSIPAIPDIAIAQGKSLKDQLVGTWIYVSSTAKRADGSSVPRPQLQGAVTYTA